MAEGLLKKKIEAKGLSNIKVYSCGVFAETGDYSLQGKVYTIKE
jgi:protein-tyrosine-phosphatase